MTRERKELIQAFEKFFTTNPNPSITAAECANIAEDYAGSKIKNTKNEMKCTIHDVSNSAVRPPLGLVPKWVRQKERYYEVCGVISRYYNSGKKIPIEWIEEYNELVELCC